MRKRDEGPCQRLRLGAEADSLWRDRQWRYVGASQELGWVPFARPDGSRDAMGAPTRGTRCCHGKRRTSVVTKPRANKSRGER